MNKICEGLYIGDVMHLKAVVVRDMEHTPDGYKYGATVAFDGEKKKSLLWKPHGDNWLAGEMMSLLTKKEERDGSEK